MATVLIIETKQDEEAFEEYDPDWLFMRVVKFDPSLPEGIDQSTFQHVQSAAIVVKVHRRQDTIRDLEERIAEVTGLPQDKTVIILRHEAFVSAKVGSATSVRSEVYNLAWRKSKLVEEGPKLDSFSTSSESVCSGVFYVEEGDTKEKQDTFKWHREFNKAYDVINLSLSNPLAQT